MARRAVNISMCVATSLCCIGGVTSRANAQTIVSATPVEATALAVGAGDLNGDGHTDVLDLDILIANLGVGDLATQGDLDLDKDVDNDDLSELLSLLSSTIDINSRLVIDRLVEKGLIAFAEPYTQHPQHNAPFSGSGHQKQWSHSHPNHELTVSRDWGDPGFRQPPTHDLTRSEAWPPNHTLTLSSTWNHSASWSGTWPPRHNQSLSQMWPTDHLQPTSRRWPPMHITVLSSAEVPEPPDDHHTSFSAGWAPSHALATSHEQWPPNHVLSISQGWNPHPSNHTISQSRQWPPNHFTEVSIGWPNAANPWPPNHFKTISEGPTAPPAGQ